MTKGQEIVQEWREAQETAAILALRIDLALDRAAEAWFFAAQKAIEEEIEKAVRRARAALEDLPLQPGEMKVTTRVVSEAIRRKEREEL